MNENRIDPKPEDEQPKLRGLYRNVNISVRTLNLIIVACVAVILFVAAMAIRNPGLTVTFDSRGGTDVPACSQMYGDLLEVPEPPSREGYCFTGWYTDTACMELWDTENRTIETDMTLYAGWDKLE